MGRRKSAIVRRWLSLGALTIVSACLTSLALVSPSVWLEPLEKLPFWALAPIAAIFFMGYARIAANRPLAFGGLRHPWSYPPVWFSAFWAAGLLLLALGQFSPLQERIPQAVDWVPALRMIGAALLPFPLLMAAASSILQKQPTAARVSSDEPTQQSLGSFDDIMAWIPDDRPLLDDSEDRFGHRSIARRIAQRVARGPASHAILGDLGAGKTSLRQLVSRSLETFGGGRRVRIVPADLWQYETAHAAVEGAIRAIILAFAKEVNVLAVRSLPRRYVQSISALGSWGESVAHVLGSERDPFSLLEKLDQIALAINLHFVIWVDDLERFVGEGSSSVEHERLNPVRALFHALDNRLDQFSIVVATTSLVQRIDVEKIARFTERIPWIAPSEAQRILGVFRDGAAGHFQDDVDPASPEGRQTLEDVVPTGKQRSARRYVIQGFEPRLLTSMLLTAVSTPRKLKFVLRDVNDRWARLHGEVDFDDLFVVTLIRHGFPKLFAILERHMPALTSPWKTTEDKDQIKATMQGEAEVQDETRSLARGQEMRALLGYLFDPNGRPQAEHNDRPQGFSHERYWQRYLADEIAPDELRDQAVLACLLKGTDIEILDCLESPSGELLVYFRRFLDPSRVRKMFLPLIARRARESAGQWMHDNAPGLVNFWNLWKHHMDPENQFADEYLTDVQVALELAMPNLYLVTDIEQYFLTEEDIPIQRREEIKLATRRAIVEKYADQPEQLVTALRGAPQATLLWVCWSLDRVRNNTMEGLPFEGWPQLAETIINAARLDPEVMMLQIATLVVDYPDHFQAERRTFNGDQADNLFGSRKVVLNLVLDVPVGNWARNGTGQCLLEAANRG